MLIAEKGSAPPPLRKQLSESDRAAETLDALASTLLRGAQLAHPSAEAATVTFDRLWRNALVDTFASSGIGLRTVDMGSVLQQTAGCGATSSLAASASTALPSTRGDAAPEAEATAAQARGQLPPVPPVSQPVKIVAEEPIARGVHGEPVPLELAAGGRRREIFSIPVPVHGV